MIIVQTYDNGGTTVDRYTVALYDTQTDTSEVITMSPDPDHPQSVKSYHGIMPGKYIPGKDENAVPAPKSLRKAISTFILCNTVENAEEII